jgi:hypothetical protein
VWKVIVCVASDVAQLLGGRCDVFYTAVADVAETRSRVDGLGRGYDHSL